MEKFQLNLKLETILAICKSMSSYQEIVNKKSFAVVISENVNSVNTCFNFQRYYDSRTCNKRHRVTLYKAVGY